MILSTPVMEIQVVKIKNKKIIQESKWYPSNKKDALYNVMWSWESRNKDEETTVTTRARVARNDSQVSP